MAKNHRRNRVIALLVGVVAFACAGWASADPPARVARVAYTNGAVSFSPAGENDWVQATMNRPLITGDRLWADAGARAELQIGSAVIHVSGSTDTTLLNLDDRVAQLQLAQGTLKVRVRRLDPNDVFEVDTPNLAFSIRRPGEYRVDVDPDGNATTVVVRSGQAEVYGEGAAYVIDARQSYRFAGTGLRDYDRYAALPQPDEFDRWSDDRNRRGDNSASARYVSRDVIGYEDLDEYGTWRADEGYGNVWVPTHVVAGWAPYRDGHWAWIDPWGWTWVDDAPWGFAVSHYGRWANIRGTWGWVPGPVAARPVYAPALVAFIGGNNFQLSISTGNVGGVAWFPLGPRDVYRPAYPVSRGYFTNINTSNTVINNTNITNVYNNPNVTNVTYVNRQVPGAIVAVPAAAFVRSQPVARSAVAVSKEVIGTAPVAGVAAVAPVHESVSGAAPPGRKPPPELMERAVVAKAAPPPAPVPFAAKQPALAANPGKPLYLAALAAVKPAAPVPARLVKLVGPSPSTATVKSQAGTPAAPQAPPALAPPPERREKSKPREQPGQAAVPKAGAPPGKAKQPEPVPAAPPAMKSEGAPSTRVPIDREPKQAPPSQTSPPAPSPAATAPPPPRPAPPPVTKPDSTPAARVPTDREPKQAPPQQTGRPEPRPTASPSPQRPDAERRGPEPKPEAVRREEQKTEEQLKREEEDKKRKQ